MQILGDFSACERKEERDVAFLFRAAQHWHLWAMQWPLAPLLWWNRCSSFIPLHSWKDLFVCNTAEPPDRKWDLIGRCYTDLSRDTLVLVFFSPQWCTWRVRHLLCSIKEQNRIKTCVSVLDWSLFCPNFSLLLCQEASPPQLFWKDYNQEGFTTQKSTGFFAANAVESKLFKCLSQRYSFWQPSFYGKNLLFISCF